MPLRRGGCRGRLGGSSGEEKRGDLREQGGLQEGRGLQAIEEVLEREEGAEVEDKGEGG